MMLSTVTVEREEKGTKLTKFHSITYKLLYVQTCLLYYHACMTTFLSQSHVVMFITIKFTMPNYHYGTEILYSIYQFYHRKYCPVLRYQSCNEISSCLAKLLHGNTACQNNAMKILEL